VEVFGAAGASQRAAALPPRERRPVTVVSTPPLDPLRRPELRGELSEIFHREDHGC